MRRNGMTLWEVLAIVVVLSIGTALFWPTGIGHGRLGRDRHQCQSNLKQIALATKQYLQYSDERFPSLSTVAGWREALSPFVKNNSTFQCPGEKNESEQTSDYWFNARMSGIKDEVLEAQALTAMLGDGYSSADPRVSLSQMPQSWLDDPRSPAWRHLDGLNIAFADGHVKWLRPQKVTAAPTREGYVTFALK